MVTFTNQKHIPRERRSGSQLYRGGGREGGGKGEEQKLYWFVSHHLKVSERRPLSVHLLSRMTPSIFFLLLRGTEARPWCFCNLARYSTDIVKQDRKNLRTRSKITAGSTSENIILNCWRARLVLFSFTSIATDTA